MIQQKTTFNVTSTGTRLLGALVTGGMGVACLVPFALTPSGTVAEKWGLVALATFFLGVGAAIFLVVPRIILDPVAHTVTQTMRLLGIILKERTFPFSAVNKVVLAVKRAKSSRLALIKIVPHEGDVIFARSMTIFSDEAPEDVVAFARELAGTMSVPLEETKITPP